MYINICVYSWKSLQLLGIISFLPQFCFIEIQSLYHPGKVKDVSQTEKHWETVVYRNTSVEENKNTP